MSKIKLEICLSHNSYMFLRDWQTIRKQKNLSHVIEELIKNYQYEIIRNVKDNSEKTNLNEELIKEKDKSVSYRNQIFKQKMPDLQDWYKNYKRVKN